MLKKIINFIKYHNAFSIILVLIFISSASVFANEGVRNAVLGEKIMKKSGMDNSALLAEDLENFNFEMEIIGVMEDDKNYYINYQYETLGIGDNVWQPILRQKQLVISKAALKGRDLGLYIAEEMGEIIDYEISYLKEVQKNEEKRGQTFVQETTKYTKLIGLILDTKTKELPGYEPVIKSPETIVQPEPISTSDSTSESVLDLAPISEIEPEPLLEPTPIPEPTFVPAPDPGPTSTPNSESAPDLAPTPISAPEASPALIPGPILEPIAPPTSVE